MFYVPCKETGIVACERVKTTIWLDEKQIMSWPTIWKTWNTKH